MSDFKVSEARCVQYEFSLLIRATRSQVWKGLTQKIEFWWLPDFHMLGSESVVFLELHAGGRLYEKCGPKELLWYTVLSITPHECLNLAGNCTTEYGGPSTTLLTVRLTSEDGATRLTVQDSLFGQVTDGHVESLRSGWLQLFKVGLKAWLEK